MELFQISIPVLEETCKGLSKDIEDYTRIANEVKECCDTLTGSSWEGYARDCFVEKSQVWYNETEQFIGQLTALHNTLFKKVLSRAIELNQKALRLPEILGGTGGGSGSENLLTYKEDSQETIDYCHRMLQADYDEAWDLLESGKREISSLSYAQGAKENLTGGLEECFREIAAQKARLRALQTELWDYGEGIRELEAEVIKDMSVYEMPQGWTVEMVELHRQLAGFKTIEAGVLTHNWSQLQEYVDKVWDTLPERERAELLEQLKQELMGKEILGVDDPRKLLDIVTWEEKGYLVIDHGTISYQIDYIEERLKSMRISRDDLSRAELSSRELEEINRVLAMIFDEAMYPSMKVVREDGDRAEEAVLLLYLALNKEALMKKMDCVDETEYQMYAADRLVMLDLWQSEYRRKFAEVEAMSSEERLKAFPLGEGNPKNDFLFLDQMYGYTKEQRLQLLELGKFHGKYTIEDMERILGREIPSETLYDVTVIYRASRAGMDYGDFLVEGYANGLNEIQIGADVFLLPRAIESVYTNSNPKYSEESLNKGSVFDRMEYESKYGMEKGPNALPAEVQIEGSGASVKNGNYSNTTFASEDKLVSHFEKHGDEFKGIFNSSDEYLQGARDVMNNGYKVEYSYKGDIRTGYVQFMGNNSKGKAKFAFVGTNNNGYITTFHTESGKTFWKLLNGENIPVINPK